VKGATAPATKKAGSEEAALYGSHALVPFLSLVPFSCRKAVSYDTGRGAVMVKITSSSFISTKTTKGYGISHNPWLFYLLRDGSFLVVLSLS